MKKLFLLCFLLLAVPAEAAVYWASTTGNGATCGTTGTGDPGSGYTTLAKGVTCLAAGDTLNLKGGTYPDSNRIVTNSGSSFSNPITIKSAPGEVVTFTGTLPIDVYSGSFSYVIIDGSNGNTTPCSTGACTTNIIFDGALGGSNITTNLAHHIRWKGVEIKNMTVSGFQTNGIGHELINSRVHNNGTVTISGTPQDHGMYLGAQDSIIDGNDIYSNCGAGIQAYSGTNMSANNNLILRNNLIRTNGTCGSMHAIIVAAGTGMKIYTNVVYSNNGAGITVYNIGANGTVVYNNTVYGNAQAGLWLFPGPAATGTVWRNNISANNAGSNIDWSAGSVTSSNNLCSGAATGCNLVETATTTFTNPGSGDFTLKTSPVSIAVNAGATNIAPGVNIAACSGGVTVNCYNGALPDLGALETGSPGVGGGPPTLTPNLTSVAAGQVIQVTVDDDDTNERTESTGDWVGIYSSTTGIQQDWFYMNGTKVAPTVAISDAVITFTAPATAGAYEFRFYQNGSSLEADRLATTAFTVTAPGIVIKFAISALKIGPSVTMKIGTP